MAPSRWCWYRGAGPAAGSVEWGEGQRRLHRIPLGFARMRAVVRGGQCWFHDPPGGGSKAWADVVRGCARWSAGANIPGIPRTGSLEEISE